MKWIRRLLFLETPTEKLKRELAKEQQKAFQQQRKGDLEASGKHQKRVEEIVAELSQLEFEDESQEITQDM